MSGFQIYRIFSCLHSSDFEKNFPPQNLPVIFFSVWKMFFFSKSRWFNLADFTKVDFGMSTVFQRKLFIYIQHSRVERKPSRLLWKEICQVSWWFGSNNETKVRRIWLATWFSMTHEYLMMKMSWNWENWLILICILGWLRVCLINTNGSKNFEYQKRQLINYSFAFFILFSFSRMMMTLSNFNPTWRAELSQMTVFCLCFIWNS